MASLLITNAQHKTLSKLYYDNPLGFIEDIIVYEEKPDENGESKLIHVGSQQREVLKAIAKSGRDIMPVSVKSGHGTGKTCVASWIALWYLFTRRNSKCMIVAPTEKQAKNGLWQELKFWIDNSPFLSSFFVFGSELINVRDFSGEGTQAGWQIELRTASCQENVAGMHGKGGTLIVIDEASGITDEGVWAALDGATTDKNSMLLMIGNPTRLYGRFYDSHNSMASKYRRITLSCEVKDYRGNRKLIRQWLETHGRNSDFYRVRALGEFPKSESDSLISIDELTSCYTRPENRSLYYPIIAVDPSDDGGDCTDIVAGVGYCVKYWHTIDGKTDGIKIVTQVLKACRYLRANAREFGFPDHLPIDVIVDVTGIGTSTRDLLKLQERKENIRVVENKSSWSGDEACDKMKDLLWFTMKSILAELSIPYCIDSDDYSNALTKKEFYNVLEEQVCSRKYTQPNGKIVIETKQQLKSRGMKSPDKGDALSLYSYQLQKYKPKVHYGTATMGVRIRLSGNKYGVAQ